jgi:hypothetical protein
MKAPWETQTSGSWRFESVRNEPVTIITAAAAAVSALGSIQQGRAAAAAANTNAAVASRNAGIAAQQAKADAEAKQRQVDQMMGAARAAYGASGVTPEGSPLDVLSASASLGELDRQNVLYKGRLREIGFQDTAAIETSSASAALTRGMFNAGSALLKGGAKLYDAGAFSSDTQEA